MNYNLILLKNKSKEKGTIFCALCIDLGYKKMYLSCDSSTIAEYLNVTVLQLNSMIDKIGIGEMLKVGSVNINFGVK